MKLRNLIFAAILYPLSVFSAGDTIRILAVGNSFSIDAVEQELIPLAKAEGINLIVGNLYIGGCSLEQHANNIVNRLPAYSYRELRNERREVYENTTLNDALRLHRWDIITMQQASHFSGQWQTYEPWLGLLCDSVKAICPNAKTAWHMTWAYAADATHDGFSYYQNNQQTMYEAIKKCTILAMNYGFDLLIPAGVAVQLGRKTQLGDSFCRDGYHLNYEYGRYTAACVWLEALTGCRPHCRKEIIIWYYANQSTKQNIKSSSVRSRMTERLCRKAAHKAVRQGLNF